ncbi:hypothetical protein LTR91_006603 [Friedmanniomyces endolithicus]|uniref:GST N-terminal domain-containing protein n=1 Tax=Friedmanniomyces endolithicus TaxID=329885 RepID=A0AAN6KRP4_9PEZI|nr:hypothetical protein LTR57_002783 [Friedmanniomyces endolithicus]KAK0997636.1 hypothetical protein LTR91_006603 [Friedmanniomyces endolithicus]KAK1003102.1 hypothetical protein LTS01_003973 [Friedmanniomyces endolithicus]KAK1053071.1 hypothetical protein LTS16_001494 [Friedmanniomyces endolithicus]
MSSNPTLLLWDHPTSSYAQKVRIALREKQIPFTSKRPLGLGSGGPVPDLADTNPRLEVPCLEDSTENGEVIKIFDSTIILAYLEDKFPDLPLLPRDPGGRAEARMIEEVCDTAYEATNWGFSEVSWSKRAEGGLAERLMAQVKYQTGVIQAWLAEKLGGGEYFNGRTFGYADVCVAPVLNRSVYYGFGPAEGTALWRWLGRVRERESVRMTFGEMEEGARVMEATMKGVFMEGTGRRQYRDYRLEWMIKSGGIEVVLEGLRRGNVRFNWPPAML